MSTIESVSVVEHDRLLELETTIRDGKEAWLSVGMALAEIREKRLYRAQFPTFAAYCGKQWGWGASRARQLIAGYIEVEAERTVTSGNAFDAESNYAPKTEREARRRAKAKRKTTEEKCAADNEGAPEPEEPPRVRTMTEVEHDALESLRPDVRWVEDQVAILVERIETMEASGIRKSISALLDAVKRLQGRIAKLEGQ